MNIPYVMKKCTTCGRWLVASTVNFNKNKNGKYGLCSKCKECYNSKQQAIENPVNTDPNILQRCTSCGKRLPATLEYFNKSKKGKYGLRNECKECGSKYKKQYYEANKDKIAEHQKQYREANKDKKAEYDKQYYEANKDKIAEYKKQYDKQYSEANKDKIAKKNKQWREVNKEKISEYSKQYYLANKDKMVEYRLANKDKMAEYNKQYRETNKEKLAKQRKQYRQTPQGQVVAFNSHQRRRIKEEQQGTGLTKDQWLEMMNYFDWKCAYSGEYLGGSDNSFNRTIDHIVPLDTGGDNMVWNTVPMLRNLNSSKNTQDMLEWYKQQDFFSEERLAKIYEWQEYAYNKWGKDTEYFNTNDIQISLI